MHDNPDTCSGYCVEGRLHGEHARVSSSGDNVGIVLDANAERDVEASHGNRSSGRGSARRAGLISRVGSGKTCGRNSELCRAGLACPGKVVSEPDPSRAASETAFIKHAPELGSS